MNISEHNFIVTGHRFTLPFQEVIQLLHAAIDCLGGSLPDSAGLGQSCRWARSVVAGFHKELLLLMEDLRAEPEGGGKNHFVE